MGLAWIKPSKKDMAVTSSYSPPFYSFPNGLNTASSTSTSRRRHEQRDTLCREAKTCEQPTEISKSNTPDPSQRHRPTRPPARNTNPPPQVTGPVPPLTLLLAPNEAKPPQTTVIHHGAKWRIPKHHMTARDLPSATTTTTKCNVYCLFLFSGLLSCLDWQSLLLVCLLVSPGACWFYRKPNHSSKQYMQDTHIPQQ